MLILAMELWRRALRGLGAIICNWIYSLIAFLFQVFVTVAQANIFDENTLGPIYQRITLILTIVMTFYITFEFVKYIIQPDTMGDKEKGIGNIGLKIIIVIVLIAMVPKIFSLAYSLQGRILNQNVIGKVILGSAKQDYNKIGNEFSADMLETFYYVDEKVCGSCTTGGDRIQDIVKENLDNIRKDGNVNILPGITEPNDDLAIGQGDKPWIHFDGLMAIAVGGLIVYILILYSIDLGLRYAQLLYLQVMAPIAIMGYLLPKKDGIFQKWTKQCLTTYLDVFIRLSLMYFALLLINLIGKNRGDLFAGIPGTNGTVETFAYIAIILGLLLFVQKAPKLLQDLLGQSSVAGIGMGLGTKDRFEPTKKAAKGLGNAAGTGRRVAGGVAGLAAGGIAGRSLKGALAGAKTGFSKNNKGLVGGSIANRIKKAAAAGGAVRQKREDIENEGGTIYGAEHFAEHYKNVAQAQDRRKANLEAYSKAKSSAENGLKDIKFMKQLEAARSIAQADGNGAAVSMIENKMSDIKKLGLRYAAGDITALEQRDASGKLVGGLEFELEQIKKAVGTRQITDPNDSTKTITVDKVSFDTESKDNVKWGNVNVFVQQAAAIAETVCNEEYTKPDGTKEEIFKNNDITSMDHNNGGLVKDSDGNIDYAKFAKEMGKIEDSIKNATSTLTVSDEYKRAHANAKGADNK